jgi:DNA-directed RNA polymerase subunit RPC12/RpoP
MSDSSSLIFGSKRTAYIVLLVSFLVTWISMSKPWYSRDDAKRLDDLRKMVGIRGTKSITQYLKENPGSRDINAFAHAPHEHETLDKLSLVAAIVRLIGLVLGMFGLVDKPGVPQPAPLSVDVEPQIAEPVIETTPASYKVVCAYCGGTIVTELTPGQPISCPHCGAALKTPNV